MSLERLAEVAKSVLLIPIHETLRDATLWEHSERVMQLTQVVARAPELAGRGVDLTAMAAAALFHDAGWMTQYEPGRSDRWQILNRPTNEIQRELGAALLLEQAGDRIPAKSLRLAADAIRQCNDRRTQLTEAQVLAEAESLDEIGLAYLLRQYRQQQAEGRPLTHLIHTWKRQTEYRYWEMRLSDGFRFESIREMARKRIDAVGAFIAGLEAELAGLTARAGAEPGQA